MIDAGAPARAAAVTFENISKVYPNGTAALESVSFRIEPQVIHALCGENGAGKSTLMKILFGLEAPNSGRILLGGHEVSIRSPVAAASHGIGMVHQHFSLLPSMTVAENIALGNEPRRGPFVDRKAARERAAALAERYRLNVDPDAPVRTLSIAAQQKVEILKALSRKVSLLILDEPTAVLAPLESEELFERLLALRAAGLTIVFISHRLREVRQLADHVSVLRGGRVTLDAELAAVSDAEITSAVMGRRIAAAARREHNIAGKPRLEFEHVSVRSAAPGDTLADVSLSVHAGEILGIAGVDGSGQSGLTGLLSGRLVPEAGDIRFDGTSVAGATMRDLRRAGMAHLPADRFAAGGAATMSLAENITAEAEDIRAGAFIDLRKRDRRALDLLAEYNVKFRRADQPLKSLSGGNAQKVVAAREFATGPQIVIADQPTRGIDAGAAAMLHAKLRDFSDAGAAVLLISADLDEILVLSDTIVTLYAGRVSGVFRNAAEVTPEMLGPYMLGLAGAD